MLPRIIMRDVSLRVVIGTTLLLLGAACCVWRGRVTVLGKAVLLLLGEAALLQLGEAALLQLGEAALLPLGEAGVNCE